MQKKWGVHKRKKGKNRRMEGWREEGKEKAENVLHESLVYRHGIVGA